MPFNTKNTHFHRRKVPLFERHCEIQSSLFFFLKRMIQVVWCAYVHFSVRPLETVKSVTHKSRKVQHWHTPSAVKRFIRFQHNAIARNLKVK